ncbi:tRNA (N6-isopentenyl adenosine(37)-C2)-methylthiotransferase MiaB [Candidatus Margulisiibacteriota bacterium]
MKNVYIETYGCQMNVYDTELINSILINAGYKIISDIKKADIYMLNTCSVRENANNKIYARVGDLNGIRKGSGTVLGILGCMASNFKDELLNHPKLKIDFIASPDSYRSLPQLLSSLQIEKSEKLQANLSEFETYENIYPTRQNKTNAWVAIMRGCNNFCSYCVVPYTRGRERSRKVDDILGEITKLVSEGFTQVTLLGQNVNSYNSNSHDFTDLLYKISDIKGLKRIRFTSPHPKDFSDKIIKAMAERENICNQLHLPLQAGSTRILEKMNRTYSQADYWELVKKIRSAIPDIVLSTDIIVGFPSENEKDFQDTVNVMEQIKFDSAFIFKYSERKPSLAAEKYPDDVAEEIKTKRIVKLNEIQKQISYEKNIKHAGQIHTIMIEEKRGLDSARPPLKVWEVMGRNEGNKIVTVPLDNYQIGDYLDVKIIKATPHALRGAII